MSYGSTYSQFDSNGSKLPRPSYRKEYYDRNTRLVHYEKEFNVSLSRPEPSITHSSSLKDSMVAYSRKMRTLQDARMSSTGNTKNDPLFVRAKHIPKYPVRVQKKRRPLSFDELLGRDREAGERPNGAKPRPHSDKRKPVRENEFRPTHHGPRLPLISDKLKKSGPNIQVSLVSASDLYEFVDFSLKNKGTCADSLQMLRLENEGRQSENSTYSKLNRLEKQERLQEASKDEYDMFQRTNDTPRYQRDRNVSFESDTDSKTPSNSMYPDAFGLYPDQNSKSGESKSSSPLRLPSISNDAFRYRPKRVKRMKLHDPMLGDIPEDNVIHITESVPNGTSGTQRRSMISPPPKLSPRSHMDTSLKHHLDSIAEIGDKSDGNSSTNNLKRTPNNVIYNGDISDTDNLDYSTDGNGSKDTDIDNDANNEGVHGAWAEREQNYRSVYPLADDQKETKKILIRDDGDIRIEVTQCPPKHEPLNSKLKAQKKIKRLIYLRDGSR